MSTTQAIVPEGKSGALSHKQIMTILTGLLLGMFLAALDQTIVATAMRTIADKLDGLTAQAWVTTAYLITSTVTTPLYGKLSDMYGRKPFYMFAISVFVIGSMLCGTAHSIYELAAYRGLQGVGAGGLMSLAFAIVGDIVPPRERGRYQAYFMGVFGSSSVLGPVLGGFLAGQSTILGIAGWRWIFYINVPIGIIALIVVFRVLNLPHTRSQAKIDYWGAVLLTVGIVPLLIVAEKGNEWGWGSPTSLSYIIGGVVALGLFGFVEVRQGADAILPLRFFRNSVFSVTSAMGFLVGAAMFGGLSSIPLYLQIVKGESPTKAGLLLIPLMVGIIVASATSGRIMMKTGRYKIFPIIGSICLLSAMALFYTLQVGTALWITGIFMAIMGAGLGLSMQTLVVAVQNAMPPKDMGVVTGANTFFRSMGGTFGTAVFLSILFNSVGGNIKDRFATLTKSDPTGYAAAVKTLTPLQAKKLQGGGSSSSLNDSGFINGLPHVIKNVFLHGFADSMHEVFLVAAIVCIPIVVLSFFIKEVALRSQGGLAAANAEAKQGGDGAIGAAAATGEDVTDEASAKAESAIL
ncbi:MDR family MFS transporter [Acidothermaceae bacterium B102]|nr:MDR family MFS transporter [Acidothermaceae bacterium B102]